MNLYFATLGMIVCASLLGYYICRPNPMLHILKKYVFESLKDVSFISFFDDCVPEIYQPDATNRGTYANPLRIYFKTHYSFNIQAIQRIMYRTFLARIFYLGKTSVVCMKFEIQDHDNARCILREFRGRKKIEYLILIKRKKVRADELTPHARSLISVSIAYRIKRF